MLTDEQVEVFHASWANDGGSPAPFARVVRGVWAAACEACAVHCEAMGKNLPPVQTEGWRLAANVCRAQIGARYVVDTSPQEDAALKHEAKP